MNILVINGPNLNMLGIREKSIYGQKTYGELCDFILNTCRDDGIDVEIFQSNHEGDLVDKIQQAYGVFDGIVINPAAYTHTSIAIPDALKAVNIPCVEVHLSDIYSREEFRHVSYVSPVAEKSFIGHGFAGYKQAIEHLKGL
ncbi:MAG: type II 3-dehydroquinate dehydratase [Oscillospiraceae bacterium]|jgi:3-dehydroquinate dehydratase-2|nr:type II 3-dehydroquinate dehydratase [Oscillospiraceae bacterium]